PGEAGSTLATGHIARLNVSLNPRAPLSNLSVGLSYDYTDGPMLPFAPVATDTRSKYVNAVTGYLFCQATEKLKFAGRAEYTSASNDYWYPSSPTSHNAQLLGLTGTADYSLWKNVITRSEVRWDHSL